MHEPTSPAAAGVDPTLCPICGRPNGCGAARGEATCWCETAVISTEVLERIPVEARGRACVCRECAGVGEGQRMDDWEAEKALDDCGVEDRR